MPARLNGTTSGYTELAAADAPANNTIVLPANSGSAYQVLRNGATPGTTEFADKIVSETAKAYNWNGLTNNTSIDFIGIPSWVKRITVMLSGVSTSGTNGGVIVQLGTSSGIENTGYLSVAQSSGSITTYSAGFYLDVGLTPSAAITRIGALCISMVANNTWVASGNIYNTSSSLCIACAGNKTLAGTLSRVRITTINGTDTFDAGTVNILYE